MTKLFTAIFLGVSAFLLNVVIGRLIGTHREQIAVLRAFGTSSGVFSKGLIDSYKKISGAFQLAFSRIGLAPELKLQRKPLRGRSPLCFQSTSYGEITVNSRKVIGSAQRRWPDGLLQQGSVPFVLDEDEIAEIFKLKSYEPGGKFAGLRNILPDLSINSLKDTIKTSFEETFDIMLIHTFPSQEEISFANDLEARKYLSPLWNFQR